MTRHVVRAGVGLGGGALLVTGGVVLGLHRLVNDTSVPVRGSVAGSEDRVLAVVAHPDDEISMAGTLAAASEAGADVTVLCLSRGEASKAAVLDGKVGAAQIGVERLAVARAAELRASCAHLGAQVLQDIYADGSLSAELTAGTLVATVDEVIRRFEPTVIVSLDDVIGLYGHPDHVASAASVRQVLNRWAEAATLAGRDAKLPAWYQVTLPARLVTLARRISPVFARATTDALPPSPDLAVRLTRTLAGAKRAAVLAHASQAPVLGDVQPGWNQIPHRAYYALFDREYLAVAAGPNHPLAAPRGGI